MKNINEVVEGLARPLNICDTTLLDSEKAPGVVLSNIEKYRMAQLLDEAGIPQIEVGSPLMGIESKKAIRHIARMGLGTTVSSWNRAVVSDIDASLDCDVDAVTISIPVSDIQIEKKYRNDRDLILDMVYEAVTHAASHGLYVSCCAEDASRADLSYLIDFAKVSKECGAQRVEYCDTIGIEDPFTAFDRLKTLKQIVNVDYAYSARNDMGMATANSIAAIKAGCRFVSASSMGISDGAGKAAIEEVAIAAKHTLNIDSGLDSAKFREIAEAISFATGNVIPSSKPVIGEDIFSFESVFIIDGVLKNGNIGEAFDASEVGAQRKALVGKNSTNNTIIWEMSQMGINLEREQAEVLLDMVRKASIQTRRCMSQKELYLLYEDMMSGNDIFDENELPPTPGDPVEPVAEEQVPEQSE